MQPPPKNRDETEAERLLRKARELRAAATKAEAQVHGDLTQRKAARDAKTDAMIHELFGRGTKTEEQQEQDHLVQTLRTKRWGMTTLEQILLRLDERQLRAQGWEHVEARDENGHVEFVRVSDAAANPDEAARLEQCVQVFLDAVAAWDAELRQKQEHTTTHSHWGGGQCAAYLRDRLQQIRRERSEHFQKRMQELQEAQRRKEDHTFDGYHDLGSLN